MSTDTTSELVVYPESDGKPMADNTLQWDWMVKIVGELRTQYAGQQVFVAGDLFWYPVEGNPKVVAAPDALSTSTPWPPTGCRTPACSPAATSSRSGRSASSGTPWPRTRAGSSPRGRGRPPRGRLTVSSAAYTDEIAVRVLRK
jgi:hypothetical protein